MSGPPQHTAQPTCQLHSCAGFIPVGQSGALLPAQWLLTRDLHMPGADAFSPSSCTIMCHAAVLRSGRPPLYKTMEDEYLVRQAAEEEARRSAYKQEVAAAKLATVSQLVSGKVVVKPPSWAGSGSVSPGRSRSPGECRSQAHPQIEFAWPSAPGRACSPSVVG